MSKNALWKSTLLPLEGGLLATSFITQHKTLKPVINIAFLYRKDKNNRAVKSDRVPLRADKITRRPSKHGKHHRRFLISF